MKLSLIVTSSDSDLSMQYSSSPFGSDWSSILSELGGDKSPEADDSTVEHTCMNQRKLLIMILPVILQAMNLEVIGLGTATGKLSSGSKNNF